ncbi:MAG: glycosyltransferase [Candidatus Sericytochromatia bacterium]|nr:glycosyltransferase [Candidatus Sericytochromatia bacterium]
MKSLIKLLINSVNILISYIILAVVILISIFILPNRKTLIWGCIPLINNKYWSDALKKNGYQSLTLMRTYYSKINKRSDFDLYFSDLLPDWLKIPGLENWLQRIAALLYVRRNASTLHITYQGFALGDTPLWFLEAQLYQLWGIQTCVMPYGADAYLSSLIQDPSLRHVLQIDYPQLARSESKIAARVQYWNQMADVVLSSVMIDGMGRWDCLVRSSLCLDLEQWSAKTQLNESDGTIVPIRIIHTPNHRGFKGTEFLLSAISELKSEGLKIDLVLLEGIPNDEVRIQMQQADILVEQLITGYGMSAVEGMASGLVVISNLENLFYTEVFRRYSYFSECPIVSSSPEKIKETIRILIKNPEIRKNLSRASALYAKKYHSYNFFSYLFTNIYRHLNHDSSVDLINLFHPLKSEYSKSQPYVTHPLINNQLLTK